MTPRTFAARALLATAGFLGTVFALGGCGDDGGGTVTDPTVVTLGETTFVVVMNPSINDANDFGLPVPGAQRGGVSVVDLDTAIGGQTSADGIVVLGLPDGGDRSLEVVGDDASDTLTQPIRRQDLVEVALSVSGDGVQVMRRLVTPFGGEVVELTPEMGIDAVNDALAESNRIVLLGEGTYEGDLVFAGSELILFGAGETGGAVTIMGDVTMSGSNNRIRGARITGSMEISGSQGGLTFSRIDGTTTVSGSNSVLLENDFCGTVDVTGSGSIALGNRGLAPLPASGC